MIKTLLSWVDERNIKPVISNNIDAISFLQENSKYVDWMALSRNPNAIDMLFKNINRIVWCKLSKNTSPNVTKLLEYYANVRETYYYYYYYRERMMDYFGVGSNLDLYELSKNPSAVPFLEKHPKYIDWRGLSGNINAISILEKNLDKEINWWALSSNINAISILEKNMDKVNWRGLSRNVMLKKSWIHVLDGVIVFLVHLRHLRLRPTPPT